MATGKFEKDNPLSYLICIEDAFASAFLPSLSPVCIKTYVYLIYLCNHSELKINSIQKFARAISLTEDDVACALDELNKKHLINYTAHPFSFEVCSATRAQSFEAAYSFDTLNAYSDYFAGIRALFPGRSISSSEYDLARDWIELYDFSVEAALLLISHCITIKDKTISFKYMDSVALSWANEGIITSEAAEEYIVLYQAKHHDAAKLLLHLGIKRTPTADEVKLYQKWEELGFNFKAIIAACSETTKTANPSFAYVDRIVATLYSLGLTEEKSIKAYLSESSQERRALSAILFELGERSKSVTSAHLDAIKPFASFKEHLLLLVAKKCSALNIHSFKRYCEILAQLSQNQAFSEEKINAYFENYKTEQKQKTTKPTTNINRNDSYNVFTDTTKLEV